MIEIIQSVVGVFVRQLWWDDLPGQIQRRGLPLTMVLFLGRASMLGLMIGSAIGLALSKSEDALLTCSLNGCAAFGTLALFTIGATLIIDPDRLV